jgi:hypothetical protein
LVSAERYYRKDFVAFARETNKVASNRIVTYINSVDYSESGIALGEFNRYYIIY